MLLRELPTAAMAVARAGIVRPVNPLRLAAAGRELCRWGLSLAGAMAATAALDPDGVLVVDEWGALTRAEVHRRSNALGHGLRRLGVGPGDLVGVLVRNDRGFVEATVALAKLGAEALYLNTGFAGPQLREVLDREGPVALVFDAEFRDLVAEGADVPVKVLAHTGGDEGATAGASTIDALIAGSPDAGLEPPSATGRSIILTSGTTGTPKGAAREHHADARPGVAILERIPYRYGDVMLVAAPLFHSWGFGHLVLGMLLDARTVLQRHFDPEPVLAAVDEHRVTVLAAVPVMLQRILDLPARVRARYDTSSLRVVALAGSSIPAGLVPRWTDAFGETIYNLYGSTEVGWVAIATPEDLRQDPATAGRPPLFTDVRLLDHRGRPVATGESGRIFVRSPLAFGGYTDGRSKEVVDGYMSTGDIGRFDDRGRLTVEGRDDDMIVSGGENVFPREVEDLISGHPDVDDVAVIGVPDDRFGQRLRAFVVRRAGSDLDAAAVKAFVRQNLARYKVPRDVEFPDEIPRNATGKVLNQVLADRYRA